MMRDFIFTSESVTRGHPDKLCDQISDAIVDGFLELDPFAQVEAECAVATGTLFLATHFASSARLDLPTVARETLHRAGYAGGAFDAESCSIMTSIAELPMPTWPEVDERTMDDEAIERTPVQHQVTLFGFACRQSPSLMPLPITLAHQLARALERARTVDGLGWLMPDGKTQVAVEYHDRRPARIHAVALTAALDPPTMPTAEKVHAALVEHVVEPTFAPQPIRPDHRTQILVNPGGPFLVGGPTRHAGLTGRKTAIDTYGEYARHSGAALSGKDPTRIDRVGAYVARWAAKNVVAAGLAEECEVHLSYMIGKAQPVSLQVDTFGTGRLDDAALAARVAHTFDFRLAAIIAAFDLRHRSTATGGGFFEQLAAYGHVGRDDLELPWESVDRAAALRD